MTEYILLGFLTQKDMTGYEMKQKMSLSTSYFVDASFGSIYPSLKRLEQKKFIESKETTENGKLKKTYTINENGVSEFRKWLSSPIEASRSSFSPVLAKIFFFRHLPAENVITLLEQYIHDMESYKSDLLCLKNRIEKNADAFELCTLDFGLDCYDFIINWYKNYLKENKKRHKERYH